jgi:hypothetical protein
MAKKKPESQDNQDNQKEFIIPKGSQVDKAVTVISLQKDRYHKDGEEFEMAETTAKKLAEIGWVKIKEENEEA